MKHSNKILVMRITKSYDAHLQRHEPNNLTKKRTDLWWCRVSRDLNDMEKKNVLSDEIIKAWMDDVLQGLLFKTRINVEVQYWKIVQYKKIYIYTYCKNNQSKTIAALVLYVMDAKKTHTIFRDPTVFSHWEAARWIIFLNHIYVWLHCMVSLIYISIDKYHHDDGWNTAVH